jgi:hypothetical protein
VALRVDAPGPRTGGREEQEDEAEQNRRLALVEHGHQRVALAGVRHEVGHRHLARQHERRDAREQADDQQRAAHRLQHAGQPDQRHQLHAVVHRHVRHVEQLGHAMHHEQVAGDDAQQRLGVRRVAGGGRIE